MKHWTWQTVMGLLMLGAVALLSWKAGTFAASGTLAVSSGKGGAGNLRPAVVIDVGHGGRDPGKVGIEGQLEKDINLSIALRLKEYLEASDVDVILTREDDNGLYPEGERNKKMSDMKKRCQIIEKAAPDLVVSIHQNSYHEESVSGGQVFYYKNSQKGKTLAEILQKRFNYVLGEKNSRQAKANGNYYLLLHVKPPIAIVECGFLSNRAEAAKLQDEVYQDRMAWTVHMGIMEFLNREVLQDKQTKG